ncbi:MAG: rod shape-determining protein MreC, partial [Flavobacteriales bacterium]|nr:rod shape-determining protein MreC [Flavobacteriales bacterium]
RCIQPGDSIVTTGFSTFFPEGVLVGRVAEVINDPGHDFIELIVDLAIDFERLDYVDVVENLMRQEQKDLETLMSEEE